MREREEELESTEITLGTGKLLGLFLGLVVICAIFFSLGYAMGKNSGSVTPQMTTAAATLPAGTGAPKPTPGMVTDPAPAATTLGAEQTTSDPQTSGGVIVGSGAEPQTAEPPSGPKLQTASATVPDSTEVATGAYYVQVAAVSKQEDAQILVNALKKKNYPALIAKSTDSLFHVQVGPFTDGTVARAAKDKLSSDGYSPILKRQ